MICFYPEIMKIMRIVMTTIWVLQIAIPIVLIVSVLFDLIRILISGDNDIFADTIKKSLKKVAAAAIVFLVPMLTSLIMNVVGENSYTACIKNFTKDEINAAYITRANEKVIQAESTLSTTDIADARSAVAKLADGTVKNNYNARLNAADEAAKQKAKDSYVAPTPTYTNPGSGTAGEGSPLTVNGYSTNTGSVCSESYSKQCQTIEPDPRKVISCWDGHLKQANSSSIHVSLLRESNFVFPTENGKMMGSWPSNYQSIPTQLTSYKTYGPSGAFIFPIDLANGVYNGSYDHNGIDLTAYYGTPVYSPVDGTLMYSEWGHTGNKGGDESAYSVSIKLPTAIKILNVDKGTSKDYVDVKTIFLTHLSGIRYRCSSISNCNRTVKKGELLGFSGNASGSCSTGGWAPHLHMTVYSDSDYETSIKTDGIEQLYGLAASSGPVKAGG